MNLFLKICGAVLSELRRDIWVWLSILLIVSLAMLPNLLNCLIPDIALSLFGFWVFGAALLLSPSLFGLRVRTALWLVLPVVLAVPGTIICLISLKSMPTTFLFLALVESNQAEMSYLVWPLIIAGCGGLLLGGIYYWMVKNRIPQDFKLGPTAKGLVAAGLLLPAVLNLADGDSLITTWAKVELRYRNSFPTSTFGAALEAVTLRGKVQSRRELVDNLPVTEDEAFQKDPARQVHMLVIGESASRACFGLYGYDRETTPLLQRTNDLMVFRDVTAPATVTLMAVPQLLTPIGPGNLLESTQQPSVLTAYRRAGYQVYWLSTQLKHGTFDTLTSIFSEDATEAEFLSGRFDVHGRGAYSAASDLSLIPEVRRILGKGERKVLFVLHTIGSHGPYTERYPEKMAPFPVDKAAAFSALTRVAFSSSEDRDDLQMVQDSYDNSIFATDSLLANLIHTLKQTGSSSWFWYVSDHGENTSKSMPGKFMHGVVSEDVVGVPLLAWLSPEYQKSHPDRAAALRAHLEVPFAAASTFHTLLDLGGLSCPELKPLMSVARSDFQPGPRLLWDSAGKIVNVDEHFEATRPGRGGWKPFRSKAEKALSAHAP